MLLNYILLRWVGHRIICIFSSIQTTFVKKTFWKGTPFKHMIGCQEFSTTHLPQTKEENEIS